MDELESQLELERQARQRTIDKMLMMTHWYTFDELTDLLNCDAIAGASLLKAWQLERRIFAVDNVGQQLFAKFQFDGEHRPLPVIAEILALLVSADGWAIAAWFLFQNGWISNPSGIGSAAPIDVLGSSEQVLAAAKRSHGTHFA